MTLGAKRATMFYTGCPNKFQTGILQKIAKCYQKTKKKTRESLFTFQLSSADYTNIFDKTFKNSNLAQNWDFH